MVLVSIPALTLGAQGFLHVRGLDVHGLGGRGMGFIRRTRLGLTCWGGIGVRTRSVDRRDVRQRARRDRERDM